MKRIFQGALLLILLVFVTFTTSEAQNKEAQSTQLYKLYQMKFIFGRKYHDNEVAKDAMYSMIAMDPTDDSLKLQLAAYYFDNNVYASSLFVSADLLARNPENLGALRINAGSYENMGLRDKAIDAYESLYLKTEDIQVLYQVAMLQFEVGRYTECKTNTGIIIKNPKSKEMKLNFAKNDKEQQDVPLEAAAYNVQGMVEKMNGNKEEARKDFQKALEIQSDFALAQQNLKDLDNPPESDKTKQ